MVPEGPLETSPRFQPWVAGTGNLRQYETLYPTLKRWASLKSPFGTGSLQPLSLGQEWGKCPNSVRVADPRSDCVAAPQRGESTGDFCSYLGTSCLGHV